MRRDGVASEKSGPPTTRGNRASAEPAGFDRRAGDEEILTSREACRFLKIGRTKLWELTRNSLIPDYRVGGGKSSSLRYRRTDLLRWLDRNRV